MSFSDILVSELARPVEISNTQRSTEADSATGGAGMGRLSEFVANGQT